MPKKQKQIDVVMANRQTTVLLHMTSANDSASLNRLFRYRSPNPRAYNSYVNMMYNGRVATGLFLEMKDTQKKFAFNIDDRRKMPTFTQMPERLAAKARDYQINAVTAMRLNSNCGGIILAATGTGKTFTTGVYFSMLQGSACMIVDELTLLEQARLELEGTLLEKVGTAGDSKFEPARITVATAQILLRHANDPKFIKWYKTLDVLVIDEVHVAMNRRSISIVSTIAPKAVFGLTATLELHKPDVRMRVTALAGPKIFEYDLPTAVAEGNLSKGVICYVNFA